MVDIKAILRFIILPLSLLVFAFLFVVIYQALGLPSLGELVEIAREYYLEYGYLVVFIAALIEGFLVVNWLFPGATLIVVVVSLSTGRPFVALTMVSLVVLGFFISSILNYLMGRLAWYRFIVFLGFKGSLEKMKEKVKKYGLPIIFSTYFDPIPGSFAAVSCGILKLSFPRFLIYSLLGLIMWDTLWGVLVYFTGYWILKFLNIWLVVIIAFIWLVYSLLRYFYKAKRIEKNNKDLYDKKVKDKEAI